MKIKDELLKRVDELLMQKQELDVDSKEARALQSDIDDIMKVYNNLVSNDLRAEELQIKKQQEIERQTEARREADLKAKEINTAKLGHILGLTGKCVVVAGSIAGTFLVYAYEKVDIFPTIAKGLTLKLKD